MIVDRDTVHATRQKLESLSNKQEAIDEVRKMLDIKQALLWRSDAMAPCCGSNTCITSQLCCEVEILEHALEALERDNMREAAVFLDEYEQFLVRNAMPI